MFFSSFVCRFANKSQSHRTYRFFGVFNNGTATDPGFLGVPTRYTADRVLIPVSDFFF
jgi:hypothetical protein